MNKRIRELAEQAGNKRINDYYTNGTVTAFTDIQLQKFAELIIGECFGEIMCQLYDYNPSSNEQYNAGHEAGLKLAVSKIKEHFGVEL